MSHTIQIQTDDPFAITVSIAVLFALALCMPESRLLVTIVLSASIIGLVDFR